MTSFEIANCIDDFKEKLSTQEYLEVMNLLKTKHSNEPANNIQIFFKITDDNDVYLLEELEDYFFECKKNVSNSYTKYKESELYYCIDFDLKNELLSKKQFILFINKVNSENGNIYIDEANYIYNIGDNKVNYTINCKPLKIKELITITPKSIISKIYFEIQDKEDFVKKFDQYFNSLPMVYKTSTFDIEDNTFYNIQLDFKIKKLEEEEFNAFMIRFNNNSRNYIVDKSFYKFENSKEKIKYRFSI